MKKSLAVCLLAAVPALLPITAAAQTYAGINYTQIKQDSRFVDNDASIKTGQLSLRYGGVVNDYVSMEMRAGTTVNDESGSAVFGGKTYDQSYKINYQAGLYAKIGLPVSIFRPYVLLGYTYGEEQLKSYSGNCGCLQKTTGKLHDFSYGAGVDIYLGDHFGVNAEYTRYFDVSGTSLQGPSAGVFYRF